MWEAIYGPHPLTPAQTAQYRWMLGQLRLGWFEDVAAAQLYARAGQWTQERAAAEAAARSAATLWRLQWLNVATVLCGIIGLFVVGLTILGKQVQRAAMSGANSEVGDRREPAHFLLPYPVLLFAFICYLVVEESVGLVVSLALTPFHARLDTLSISTLLRLTQLLQIVAYIPILGIPLLILHRRIRFDPSSGEPITWRKLLARIGFRVNNPVADVGAGALGYLLVTPAVLLATLISSWLFARFHTPQNPAALEMLAAQRSLDRFLVLFVASVAAPFAEETMFRGILYSALRSRLGVWGGAAVSGSIFALVHPTLPGGFLPILAVGMGLAFVYEWRKSLLPGMVLHGLYNGFITLVTFAIFAK